MNLGVTYTHNPQEKLKLYTNSIHILHLTNKRFVHVIPINHNHLWMV